MLRNLPSDSNMSKALIMGIALASNIGGMLSPIASPQNVVAIGIMKPEPTWLEWFFVSIPVGFISILLIWALLYITFQPAKGTTIVPIRSVSERFTGVQWFVSVVTIATIGLWCASHRLEPIFGEMGVIAIIPIALFFGVGILTKEDFNNFPWTIIVLAAGGLSLGKAVKSSGLLDTVAASISDHVEGMSLYGVLVVFSCLILVIATFISHTVAALILLPLVASVGEDMEAPQHPNLLVMAGVLMCSAAMGLPTSGFPNMSTFPILGPPLGFALLTSLCSRHHEGGPCRAEVLEREALYQSRSSQQSADAFRRLDGWVRGDEGYGDVDGSLTRKRSGTVVYRRIMVRARQRRLCLGRSISRCMQRYDMLEDGGPRVCNDTTDQKNVILSICRRSTRRINRPVVL